MARAALAPAVWFARQKQEVEDGAAKQGPHISRREKEVGRGTAGLRVCGRPRKERAEPGV